MKGLGSKSSSRRRNSRGGIGGGSGLLQQSPVPLEAASQYFRVVLRVAAAAALIWVHWYSREPKVNLRNSRTRSPRNPPLITPALGNIQQIPGCPPGPFQNMRLAEGGRLFQNQRRGKKRRSTEQREQEHHTVGDLRQSSSITQSPPSSIIQLTPSVMIPSQP